MRLYRFDQVDQVVRFGWVGVVIGELAINIAIELDDVTTKLAVEIGGNHACHAIATVNGYSHRTCQFDIARDAIKIGGLDIKRLGLTRGGRQHLGAAHFLTQVSDARPVKCAACHHHLKAVVLRRVVAASDCHAGACAQLMGREINQRCGHHAQIDGVDAALSNALAQCCCQVRAA